MPATKTIPGVVFQQWQVHALLAGTISQFRMPMKPQPHPDFLARGLVEAVPQWPKQNGVRFFMDDGLSELVPSPHQPGDVLFVKETWTICGGTITADDVWYRADLGAIRWGDFRSDGSRPRLKATPRMHRDDVSENGSVANCLAGSWNSSTQMPEWASRFRIKITAVGAQRRHKITLADVLACGIKQEIIDHYKKWFHRDDAPGHAFAEKWDAQHAKRGNGWEQNGLDWRYGFM